jgi:NitT/TauT family transport system substrate-binding protein
MNSKNSVKTHNVKVVCASLLAAVLACALFLSACAQTAAPTGGNDSAAGTTATPTSAVDVRVSSLKGPTSIGLVSFMDEVDKGSDSLENNYQFAIVGTADEILPGLISKDIDIALLPANVAATLYNKTNGGVTALNINTLGVLYVVTADEGIRSLSDLAGRTVLMTGKGTTPEYVMQYLLARSGLSDAVTLEFKSEATELAALIAADPTAVAVLPEPYVTSVGIKNPALMPRISLTDAWESLMVGGDEQLVTGVTVVRTAFLQEHPAVVQEFLQHQQASVAAVNANPEQAAQLVVKTGIIENAQIAQAAIPRCNLVCLTGSALQHSLSSYLSVLNDQNPASIGGSLPPADFYYTGG